MDDDLENASISLKGFYKCKRSLLSPFRHLAHKTQKLVRQQVHEILHLYDLGIYFVRSIMAHWEHSNVLLNFYWLSSRPIPLDSAKSF